MLESINSSNIFTLQSEISQTNSSKTSSLSNRTKNENPFIRQKEKSSSNLNFEESYKLELGHDKLHRTFSMLTEEASSGGKSEGRKMTFQEINAEKKNEEMARRSWNEINEATLKSAVKLYNILKGDILLENYFDFKTGSVNFFA